MRFTGPVRWILSGPEAEKLKAQARTLFGVTQYWHSLVGVNRFRKRFTLPDGSKIEVIQDGTQPVISIAVASGSLPVSFSGDIAFVPPRGSIVDRPDIVMTLSSTDGSFRHLYSDESLAVPGFPYSGTYIVYTENLPFYHGGVDWQNGEITLSWGYLPERYASAGKGGLGHSPNYGAWTDGFISGNSSEGTKGFMENVPRERVQADLTGPMAILGNPFRMYSSQPWFRWQNDRYGRSVLLGLSRLKRATFYECGTGELFYRGKILVNFNEDYLHEDSAEPTAGDKIITGAAVQGTTLIVCTASDGATKEEFFVGPFVENTRLYFIQSFDYEVTEFQNGHFTAVLFSQDGTKAVTSRVYEETVLNSPRDVRRITDYEVTINTNDLSSSSVSRTINEVSVEVVVAFPTFTIGPLAHYYGVHGYNYFLPDSALPLPEGANELDYMKCYDLNSLRIRKPSADATTAVWYEYPEGVELPEITWRGESIRPVYLGSGSSDAHWIYMNQGQASLTNPDSNGELSRHGFRTVSRIADYRGNERVVARFEAECGIEESDIDWMTEVYSVVFALTGGGGADWGERDPDNDPPIS